MTRYYNICGADKIVLLMLSELTCGALSPVASQSEPTCNSQGRRDLGLRLFLEEAVSCCSFREKRATLDTISSTNLPALRTVHPLQRRVRD